MEDITRHIEVITDINKIGGSEETNLIVTIIIIWAYVYFVIAYRDVAYARVKEDISTRYIASIDSFNRKAADRNIRSCNSERFYSCNISPPTDCKVTGFVMLRLSLYIPAATLIVSPPIAAVTAAWIVLH